MSSTVCTQTLFTFDFYIHAVTFLDIMFAWLAPERLILSLFAHVSNLIFNHDGDSYTV
jgi:hypothetical protein